MSTTTSVRNPLPFAHPHAGDDYSGAVTHGLTVVVTPDGWTVRRRGRPVASGNESGRAGLRAAMTAAGALRLSVTPARGIDAPESGAVDGRGGGR